MEIEIKSSKVFYIINKHVSEEMRTWVIIVTVIISIASALGLGVYCFLKPNKTVDELKGQNRVEQPNREGTVVCAIAKNEELYLKEWTQYYLDGLGVNSICIYDNSDNHVLESFFDDARIKVIHFPGAKQQIPAYNHFLKSDMKHQWAIVVDCGEFIVIPKPYDLNTFLNEHISEGNGLYLQWKLFGDSGLTHYDERPVTQRFRRCQETFFGLGKSIVPLGSNAIFENPHSVTNLPLYDVENNIVIQPHHSKPSRDYVPAWIAHYFTKTHEEFMKKRARGCADNGLVRHESDFEANNKNKVKNDEPYNIYIHSQEERSLRTV